MTTAPYYSRSGGLDIQHLGQTTTTLQQVQSPQTAPLRMLLWVVDAVSIGLSAFHGYRRHNGSVGAAVGWGVLGAVFPIITPAVAFAQGFGKPMVKSNKRRTRRASRRRNRR